MLQFDLFTSEVNFKYTSGLLTKLVWTQLIAVYYTCSQCLHVFKSLTCVSYTTQFLQKRARKIYDIFKATNSENLRPNFSLILYSKVRRRADLCATSVLPCNNSFGIKQGTWPVPLHVTVSVVFLACAGVCSVTVFTYWWLLLKMVYNWSGFNGAKTNCRIAHVLGTLLMISYWFWLLFQRLHTCSSLCRHTTWVDYQTKNCHKCRP